MTNKAQIQVLLRFLIFAILVFFCQSTSCPEPRKYNDYIIDSRKSIRNGATRKFRGRVLNLNECQQRCCNDLNCNIIVYKPETEDFSTNCVTYNCPHKKCVLKRAYGIDIYAITKQQPSVDKNTVHSLAKNNNLHHNNLQHKEKPSNSKAIQQSTTTNQQKPNHFRPHEEASFNHKVKVTPTVRDKIDESKVGVGSKGLTKLKKPSLQLNSNTGPSTHKHRPSTNSESSKHFNGLNYHLNENKGVIHGNGNFESSLPTKPDEHAKPNNPKWHWPFESGKFLDESKDGSNLDPFHGPPSGNSQQTDQGLLQDWDNSESHPSTEDDDLNQDGPKYVPHQQSTDQEQELSRPNVDNKSQHPNHKKLHESINIHKLPPTDVENVKRPNHVWHKEHFHRKPTPRRPFFNHHKPSGESSNHFSSPTDKSIVFKGHKRPTDGHQISTIKPTRNHKVTKRPDISTHSHKWPSHKYPNTHFGSPTRHQWHKKPTRRPAEGISHHGSFTNQNHKQVHKPPSHNVNHIKYQYYQSTTISTGFSPTRKQANHQTNHVGHSQTDSIKTHQPKSSYTPPIATSHTTKTYISQVSHHGDKNISVSNTKSDNQNGDGFTLVLHEDHPNRGLSTKERSEFTNLIIALGVALGVVIILLIAVLLRLRRIHTRLRVPSPKDADYLINGMYL
ncbi:uncharacterized protein TRIADDRAFT_62352 [Trichoplax adhaerens]|uniref:Seven cysteines N-terminal domain-containing protein n=1 Tax=Trichoplax adhaerens TaxID=10228 RepID=B3SDJ3_TRIAD|nr:hypothetical protein TRIADDRAFT_62352 [Trichoplax adhaerens]EDV19187.1 hypothetical protein TRIADDRAFT_62352 [Trichoplax adhaerens]|eukprot:XP_002118307.1 hypothetical protein TRIADDRAFT_62352 [Trichoplax adhaerens]